MSILEGISEEIASVFNVKPKPLKESLEERINKTLAEEREKIRPSREDIDEFSWVTKDNNPIHRIPKRAKKLGFEDIPLMGAHIASYGEQYIERVVESIREYWGADIKIIGQDNSFKAPVYPGQKIFWQVAGHKRTDSEIRLEIIGTVNSTKIIDITTRLGKEYKQMPQIAGPIFSRRYTLEKEHIEAFYNCVGSKTNERVPKMMPAAFIPATLLSLLEEKTQTMEGTNLSINFDFLAEPREGRLQVDLFTIPTRKPRQQDDQYLYKFRAVCSQNTIPIIYGEILSSTKHLIEY